MLFSVTAFSQVPAEKIISMTPGLPSVSQLLSCYKAAEDPSHETVLEKNYVSDFLEAWDDARSKISDMREASKGTGIPSDIMNAQTKEGEPMVERRQGLLDRSKTIWAMVNPNDYEQVAQ